MIVHWKSGFLLKLGIGLGLVVLADLLFWGGGGVGSTLGMFAALWTGATAAGAGSLWRNRPALIAIAIAVLLAAVLADQPTLLGWMLFCAALGCAALLPRAARFGSAADWALRLALTGIVSVVGPWRDASRLFTARRRGRRMGLGAILPLLPLPMIGTAIFLALFASANPLIGDAIGRVEWGGLDIFRMVFWGVVFTMVWATLRPRRLRFFPSEREAALPRAIMGISPGSVTLSLIAFNGLFALQNALDIAFLWSGAALPKGVTLAAYAHSGAYPLIVTALLAGLFVLIALRPGSEMARVPAIRAMVIAWVGQNVFLVASTILRTLDYVEAYSLTVWRIAALVWMALVAIGLTLILWRLLAAKSATWLVNANAVAAGLALVGAGTIDLGSVAAAWNVRHAREVGGRGAALDLCYLDGLGSSALVSLVMLERTPGLDPDFAERVASVRGTILNATIARQRGGWWTWRNARRLTQVQQGPLKPVPYQGRYGRDCSGALNSPPPAPPETTTATDPDLPVTGDAGATGGPAADSNRLTQGATR